MFLQLLLCFALFVIGIQLFRGKWLMLIAGYNTSSKEQRAKINGRNLGKLIGSLILFCSFAIIMMSFVPQLDSLFAILIPILLLVSLVFANTSKLFKI
ncbi:DUF3784 domain-containing protein [Vagococcus sp. BWB3-3]|uniref:DUF3784 domain-containing protein n=1 Tax=Vagococcus allomyrinae TaxID=2794353 RepID=A0A940PGV9_9ENTE|nr:DUF3784 domain-containing protein [Vagococcus allomyrinae]MBP1042668.1 DUF3784 domain-containing protein [Vagococcus allomyrinae]